MTRLAFRHKSSAVVIAVAFGALAFASCGDDATQPTAPPPVISSLSDSTLVPGDTLMITGENFAVPASNNRVIFNNPLANPKPFIGTTKTLTVVVPEYANTGPLRVESLGLQSNTVTVEISRGVGDVWVVGGGATFSYKVEVPAAGARYVMIPHSTSASGNSVYGYTLSHEDETVYPAPPRAASRRRGATDLATSFEVRTRQQTIDYIQRYGGGRATMLRSGPAAAPALQRTFLVFSKPNGNPTLPGDFTTITASLVYDGRRALIYADDSQPSGSGFVQADYDAFGAQFDSGIFPTDSTYFGTPTDIDHNQKVIILFSEQVNRLTPPGTASTQGFISGFFLLNDLLPGIVPAGTTNAGEVFYSMVPDPNGDHGNTFSKAFVSSFVPGTLAHEFEHMISFGYRALVVGGGRNFSVLQVTWLEEGMAHMAEDLNNFDGQNVKRANLYLAAPGDNSLKDPDDTLEQRGGIYLFLRYLGDQYGEGIYRSILQSSCVGTACVDKVAGKKFSLAMADFLAALYLDGRGIPGDARYSFTSLNVQTDFDSTLEVSPADVGTPIVDAVAGTTGDFFDLSGATLPAMRLSMSSTASAQMRVIVIRTQ